MGCSTGPFFQDSLNTKRLLKKNTIKDQTVKHIINKLGLFFRVMKLDFNVRYLCQRKWKKYEET